jgi:hypothetical protein
MNWMYDDGKVLKSFTDEMIPKDAIGFVYEMTCVIDGSVKKYIGKKNFYANVKTKLGKKTMPKDGRKKKYKRVKRFTYKNYYSSNEVLKNAHKEGIRITRTILKICYSKSELTYEEVKSQFIHEVLEDNRYLNSNILGKFYKKQLNEQ